MKSCFPYAIIALVGIALPAVAVPPAPSRRVMSVVRADAGGRLVRSVAVTPVAISSRVVNPLAVTNEASAAVPPDVPVNELVTKIAARHDVEPVLVDSVIRVESAYNPYAVSHKGAQGLMQLVPSTARRYGVSNVFNPAQNIEGGVKYLKYLLELYKGDQRLALAAYNAGEGAVARYKGIPPYPETRNYVYQVGKRLGDARRRAAPPPSQESKPVREHNPIVKVVDAEGKEYYQAK